MRTGRCTLRQRRERPSCTHRDTESRTPDTLPPSRCGQTHDESDLRGAFQRDDREVLAPGKVLHVQRELHAPPPVNPGLRRCAGRTPWPTPSRLEPWRERSRRNVAVQLLGRPAAKTLVRPVLVVPGDVERELVTELLLTHRDEHQSSRALRLDCPHQPLDPGQASVLVESAEPLLDAEATAPLPERDRGELPPLIASTHG